MGLTNGVFWMAWFIDSFIIMTFSSAVLTFILSVIYNYVNTYVLSYFYIINIIDTVVFILGKILISVLVWQLVDFCRSVPDICISNVIYGINNVFIVSDVNYIQVNVMK